MKRIEEVHIIRIALQHGFNEEWITRCRDVALEYLPPSVISKVPRNFSDEIRAAYKGKGISLDWNLITTDAYEFYFSARDVDLTQSQQSAAALLYACTDALEKNALSDRVKQNILDAYAGLDLDAVVKGEKFPPHRKKGALSPKTKYINQLVSVHPDLCAKELYRIADKLILDKGKPMQNSTFDKKISQAKNPK